LNFKINPESYITGITVCFLFTLIVPATESFAHQVDSVDNYRIEIGWMNEPAFSKETNGIELFVSTIDTTIPLEDQEFVEEDGVDGLEDSIRLELVFQGDKIKLPLFNDHNVKGKYYTLVDPTVPGYYQLNVIGKIGDTIVSKSLHPPKVDNRAFIEFPQKENEEILTQHEEFRSEINKLEQTLNDKIIEEHNLIQTELDSIKSSLADLEESQKPDYGFGYISMGIASIALVIGLVSLRRK